jgi:ATP-independent RNA helicase DbpA
MEKPSSFKTLKLSQNLLVNLDTLGFHKMTPIQEKALPIVLQKQDLIGQAKTGSGKTAVFGLGILSKLKEKLFRPQALILCPTRELALQVAVDIRQLARGMKNIKVQTLTGGTSEYFQEKSLHHGTHIIVGTPGRVQKFLKKRILDSRAITTFVLDEADRMLEMGFFEDIKMIESFMPRQKQTLLFSATYPETIKELSHGLLQSPEFVKVDVKHEEGKIKQHFFEVQDHKAKKHILPRLLAKFQPCSCLIFCKTKQICQDVTKTLQKKGHSALAIHGDLDQKERTLVLTKFSNQSGLILVATDVAARGLDIKDLGAVINYDLPRDPEVYTHRIGRTGRAGKEGMALNLFIERERHLLEELDESDNDLSWNLEKAEDLPLDENFDSTPPMTTLLIYGGKKNKIRPGDILGALTGDAGLSGNSVGNINLLDRFCYVAVESKEADQALSRLQAGTIKGRKFRVSKI